MTRGTMMALNLGTPGLADASGGRTKLQTLAKPRSFSCMSTVAELQQTISRLPKADKAALTAWLESQEEPLMSAAEEAALLASLDQAARQLDAGQGVSIEQARGFVVETPKSKANHSSAACDSTGINRNLQP
jgi:hypothetical protein